MEKTLENILYSVQNPARYIGGEIGSPVIDGNARVKFCLVSPCLYERGMEDVKLKVIYHKVNDRKGNSAERVFAPWLDFAAGLKKANLKLFSLESRKALCDFDLLGAHLMYSSDYTTLLYMLSLGGVSIASSDRTDSQPFVFGFGDACVNTSVVSSFLDFVIIGDAEEVILSVIDCVKSARVNKLSREQTLVELSKLLHVCVPKLVQKKRNKKGEVTGFVHEKVKKAVAVNLDRAYFPTTIQTPNIKTIKNSVVIEPIRGCTRGCRYCTYGFYNRPIRERNVAKLSIQAMSAVTATGGSKVSFASRCYGDYSKLSALLTEIEDVSREKGAKLNVPMVFNAQRNSEHLTLESHDTIKISIEAGTENLRRKINKNLTDDEIDELVKNCYQSGYSNLILHFMIGLPFETAEDLVGLVNTVKRIKSLYKANKNSPKPVYITCNISIFCPKPFTPFAWCESLGIEEAEKRIKFIKKSLKNVGVRVKSASLEYSLVESILSRGDEKVSDAIVLAFRYGAIFDSNSKLFNFKAYKKAFEAVGIGVKSQICKRDFSVVQPWENVDMLVSKEYLISEYEKAKKGILTTDCRSGCKGCGLSELGVCKHGRL